MSEPRTPVEVAGAENLPATSAARIRDDFMEAIVNGDRTGKSALMVRRRPAKRGGGSSGLPSKCSLGRRIPKGFMHNSVVVVPFQKPHLYAFDGGRCYGREKSD